MAGTRKKSAATDAGASSHRAPVGSALADLRRDAGLAQEDVARRLGLTRVSISHYESGQTTALYSQVRRILTYFGMDLHDLQDALDQREGRPIRRRNPFEKQPILEEALLAETEALFRRWSRRVSATQRSRVDQTESEVMDLLRGLVHDLDAPEGGP
jgi:transcriptional regulator with XRE-family HTH domain